MVECTAVGSAAPEATFSYLASKHTVNSSWALNTETVATECLPRRSVYEHNFLYATYSVLIVASASPGVKVHIVLFLCCITLHGQQDFEHKLTTEIPRV